MRHLPILAALLLPLPSNPTLMSIIRGDGTIRHIAPMPHHSTLSNARYAGDSRSTRHEAAGTPQQRQFVTACDGGYRTTSYAVQAKSGSRYVTTLRQMLAYNSRGQLLVASTIDPTTSAARTVTLTYCEQIDVDAGTCDLVGLLKTIDGERADVADATADTYHAYDALLEWARSFKPL
ncbi:hypothetical protein DFR29_114168 [Tahibacter aquaticus]|uniref:Uncharacterized protein n=2 Tax=Tahibacter aquaticus TaxID=520092 RepID=A0A4R6YQJ8_9GAMM|nr:hypothetical protein DFR29_114168 [Tahibacter aquaticus]